MKNKKIHFLITTVCLLLNVWTTVSKTPPPPPPGPPAGPPPPPLGMPINDNIGVLVVMAILLGMYIIFKHSIKQKTPT